jgi:hypothetical protein
VHGPDPDAQLIMDVLMQSPRRDEPGVLLAAAKAYEVVRSARERGAIPALDDRPRCTFLPGKPSSCCCASRPGCQARPDDAGSDDPEEHQDG